METLCTHSGRHKDRSMIDTKIDISIDLDRYNKNHFIIVISIGFDIFFAKALIKKQIEI